MYRDNWPVFEKLLAYLRFRQIKPYIISNPKPVCVDIGCGFYGRFLKRLHKRIERGYGFDIRGNEEKWKNIRIVNNSKFDGKIPLKDKTVDMAFLLAVLEHLPLENQVIAESIRILKDGGVFIITSPTPFAKPILEFLAYRLHLISEESIREHKHYYSRKELEMLIMHHGCDVLHYEKFQFGFNQMIIGIKK